MTDQLKSNVGWVAVASDSVNSAVVFHEKRPATALTASIYRSCIRLMGQY